MSKNKIRYLYEYYAYTLISWIKFKFLDVTCSIFWLLSNSCMESIMRYMNITKSDFISMNFLIFTVTY